MVRSKGNVNNPNDRGPSLKAMVRDSGFDVIDALEDKCCDCFSGTSDCVECIGTKLGEGIYLRMKMESSEFSGKKFNDMWEDVMKTCDQFFEDKGCLVDQDTIDEYCVVCVMAKLSDTLLDRLDRFVQLLQQLADPLQELYDVLGEVELQLEQEDEEEE